MRNWGLASKLVSLVLVLALAPLLVMGWIVQRAAGTIEDGVGSRFQYLSAALADVIDRNLFERYGDVQAFALNTVIQQKDHWYKPGSENPLVQTMNRYVDTYDIYSLTVLVDLEGRVIAANDRDADGKPIDSAFLYGSNFAKAAWFAACRDGRFTRSMPHSAPGNDVADGTYIDDIHVDEDVRRAYPGDSGLTIGFSAPVRAPDGTVIAYWNNRSKFSNVQSILTKEFETYAADFPGLCLSLLDSSGRVLFSVRGDRAAPTLTDLTQGEVNLVTQDFEPAKRAVAGATGFQWAETSRGDRVAGGYAHLRGALGYPGMNWAVVASAPHADVRAVSGVAAIERSVYVTGGVSIAALIGLSFVAARRFVAPLRRSIGSLKDAAGQFDEAAGQISMSAQTLAESVTRQSASASETRESLRQIEVEAQTNASQAREATALAERAQQAAQNSDSTIGELDKAMTAINSSAGEISRIIKVIEEIAFQTNLLALNAAVEAARAGEHGRGFAVVAEEVRNLAIRSATAAKDTTKLIDESVVRARGGAQVAAAAGSAVRGVIQDIASIAGVVQYINAGAAEQSRAIEQVAIAIGQIENTTQQTASNAEESAAAAEQLTGMARSLRGEIVGQLVVLADGARAANS